MRAANHLLTLSILSASFLVNSCAKKDNKDEQLAAITNVVGSSNELPTCSESTMAQVYYVEEQNKLYVCNGSKFVEIKGDKGETGEKGNKGDTGEAGSPANSGVWVFDKDSKPIGVLMDASLGLVLFTNGAFARVNLGTGEYNLPVYNVVSTGGMDVSTRPYVCYSTDADCSGTCYILDPAPRGTILRASASKYYVVTGEETLVAGASTPGGSNTDGTCSDISGTTISGYPVNKIYTLPDGITFPLKTPLSYGFKTED